MQGDKWKAQAFVRHQLESGLVWAQNPEAPVDLIEACAEYRRQIAQVSYRYTSGQKPPYFADVSADINRIVFNTKVRAITVFWHGENCLFPLIECVSKFYQGSIVDGILLPIDEQDGDDNRGVRCDAPGSGRNAMH